MNIYPGGMLSLESHLMAPNWGLNKLLIEETLSDPFPKFNGILDGYFASFNYALDIHLMAPN